MKKHVRWHVYEQQIKELIPTIKSNNKIAKSILGDSVSLKEIDLLRKYVSEIRNFGFKEIAQKVGVDNTSQKMIWFKTKDFSVRADNPDYVPIEIKKLEDSFDNLSKALLSDLKDYIPKYDKIVYEDKKDAHLLVIDPADVHIG
jgi:hypothetical protein